MPAKKGRGGKRASGRKVSAERGFGVGEGSTVAGCSETGDLAVQKPQSEQTNSSFASSQLPDSAALNANSKNIATTIRLSMSGLDMPSLQERKLRFFQAAAGALQAAGVVPDKDRRSRSRITGGLDIAEQLSPIHESMAGGSSENDALSLVSTGSKTPTTSGAMCDTMEMSRCVHIFTPRTTSNLERRFEALHQVEENNESFRSPYVLTSSAAGSAWAEEEMGAYYDSSYCGNDALQYELSAASKAPNAALEQADFAVDTIAAARLSAPLPAKSKESKGKQKSPKQGEISQKATKKVEPAAGAADDVVGNSASLGSESSQDTEKMRSSGWPNQSKNEIVPHGVDLCSPRLSAQDQNYANVHPIFGRLVFQALGREIYVASARTFLSHVPLWLEQRPCDMTRVQEIVKQKKDSPIFPGVISVFQYPPEVRTSITVPQTCAIFDGQHRCLAILAILKGVDARRGSFSHQPLEQSHEFDFEIMVEVFAVSKRQHIVDLYIELNKAQPVLEIDVPDVIASSKKVVIDEACAALHKKYKPCFSNSTACRAPNVNLSVLRNALFRSKVLDVRSITSSGELIALLEDINNKLMERPQESWPTVNKARSIAKAREHGFFLGMTSSWIEDLAEL